MENKRNIPVPLEVFEELSKYKKGTWKEFIKIIISMLKKEQLEVEVLREDYVAFKKDIQKQVNEIKKDMIFKKLEP